VSSIAHLVPRNAAQQGTPATVDRAVYTVKEVALMLSLSLGGTYALIRNGEIPAKKFGGRWTVPKRRFDAWLNEPSENAA
jgi:excisionase family DNA binding protein